MSKTANISFREDEKDLYEWMEYMHNEGRFRSRSAVVVEALRRMKDDEEEEVVHT